VVALNRIGVSIPGEDRGFASAVARTVARRPLRELVDRSDS